MTLCYLPLILASTLLSVQLFSAKSSAQPTIPNAFHAQVSVYMEGYQNSADIYVNYDYDQVLLVSNLGVMSSDAGKSYIYISGSGENKMIYRYLESFDHCTVLPLYVGFFSFPQLNKLENATYVRSQSFMGRSVDVYSYDVMDYQGYPDTMTYEIAYQTSDYTPVYLIPSLIETPVIINSFSDVAPPYSKFNLPSRCTMAKQSKITKGKAKMSKSEFSGIPFLNMKLV